MPVRLGKILVSSFVSIAVATGLALVAIVPAVAATGSADPGNLQLACAGDTIDGLSTDHRYAAVYVPAGATVTFIASGPAQNGPYVSGVSGGSEYWLNFNLWNGGTSPAYQNTHQGDESYYVMAPWPPTTTFGPTGIGSWQNTSGRECQIFGVTGHWRS